MLRKGLKTAWRFLDKLSLGLAQKILSKVHKRWSRGRVRSWKPRSSIEVKHKMAEPGPKEVGVFIHVYYEDYLPRLNKVLSEFREYYPLVEFFFTSPKAEIVQTLEGMKLKHANLSKVVLSQNRGRNFGPLFVSFPKEIRDFEFVVHIHTKKSTHEKREYAQEWADLLWGNLLENTEVFKRNLSVMRDTSSASLLYPVDLNLQHPTCYGWKQARIIKIPDLDENLFGSRKDGQRFPFPIGGMFMARSAWLTGVFLRRKWSYSDFPEESGQIDMTSQHMIERLLGVAQLELEVGLTQIAFFPGLNLWTTDTSFVNADQRQGTDSTQVGFFGV
jgi:lipopolysaccharide biosynthesis protein